MLSKLEIPVKQSVFQSSCNFKAATIQAWYKWRHRQRLDFQPDCLHHHIIIRNVIGVHFNKCFRSTAQLQIRKLYNGELGHAAYRQQPQASRKSGTTEYTTQW